jgi:hypothetical protein
MKPTIPLNIHNPVKHINKFDLVEISDHKSKCPICDDGILAMKRDMSCHLLAFDVCLLCGQQFIYDDLENWIKCKSCNLFDLYWDCDNETKETCDQRRIPNNCSNYLCNDPKSNCLLLKGKI